MSVQLLIFVAILSTAFSQNHYTFKKEGESCLLPNGMKGICRRRSTCNRPWGFTTLKYDLESFQPCGFTDKDEKLFCCYATVQRAKRACDEYRTWTNLNPRKESLISNGKFAALGEFPHMVALWYNVTTPGVKTQWQCGGTLISDRFAVTAAHCLTQDRVPVTPPSKLRVGDLDLNSQDDDAHATTYDIAAFIIHPLYNRKVSIYYDIGLVKSATTIRFSSFVRPACLDFERKNPDSEFTISGYGLNETLGTSFGILRYANVNAVDRDTCSSKYNRTEIDQRNLPRGIITSLICGLSEPDIKGRYSDACEGDSGGPLQYNVNDLFYIAGLTSFGPSCTSQGSTTPGIYTRISDFVPWLETFVWRD